MPSSLLVERVRTPKSCRHDHMPLANHQLDIRREWEVATRLAFEFSDGHSYMDLKRPWQTLLENWGRSIAPLSNCGKDFQCLLDQPNEFNVFCCYSVSLTTWVSSCGTASED